MNFFHTFEDSVAESLAFYFYRIFAGRKGKEQKSGQDKRNRPTYLHWKVEKRKDPSVRESLHRKLNFKEGLISAINF